MLIDVVYRSETVAVEAATTEELALRFLEAFPSATAPRFLLRGTQLHEGPLPPPARGSAALRVMAISATVEEKAAVQAARPARLRDDLEASGPLRPPARVPLQAPRRRNNLSDEYGFASIEVLPGFADGDAARAILERLASDPGIASVMRARRWRVPVLGEMYPEGRVGTDPVCVLGYNVNRGQRIDLRLRTDDLEGFRKFAIIKNVLWHELAHNEISEHTHEFYTLVSTLTREGNASDWTRTGGVTLSSSQTVYRPPDVHAHPTPDGHTLGGARLGPASASGDPRERLAAAALVRLNAAAALPHAANQAACRAAVDLAPMSTCEAETAVEMTHAAHEAPSASVASPAPHPALVSGGEPGAAMAGDARASDVVDEDIRRPLPPDAKMADGDNPRAGDPATHVGMPTASPATEDVDLECVAVPDGTADRRRRLLTLLDRLVSDCIGSDKPPAVAVQTLAEVLGRAFDAVVGRGPDKHRSIRTSNPALRGRTGESSAVREFLLAAGFTAGPGPAGVDHHDASWVAVPAGGRADLASLWLARELSNGALQDLSPGSGPTS